jgi:hypothetical protein
MGDGGGAFAEHAHYLAPQLGPVLRRAAAL